MILWRSLPESCYNTRSTQDELYDRIAGLQRHLELDHDITASQPPQAYVVDADGNTKVVLLNTPELRSRHHAIQLQQQKKQAAAAGYCAGSSISAGALHGVNFRVSKRYRCLANPDGQVARGMGFVYEGMDLAEGTKVTVKVFNKNDDDCNYYNTEQHDDDTASARIKTELATCLRLHRGLHSPQDGYDRDLRHLIRLRNVLTDAPIEDDALHPDQPSTSPPQYSATVLIYDWAGEVDARALMASGVVGRAGAMGLFRQVLYGLRALHRRQIVHRDIKLENVVINQTTGVACLCNLEFAKHVPSVLPTDLANDPTSSHHSPERWLACHGTAATGERERAEAPRVDETPGSLYASDVFSAGIALFILIADKAISSRAAARAAATTDDGDSDGEEEDCTFNLFQKEPGDAMFGLLCPELRVQKRLWLYWESYGLSPSPALRGLLDGVLHPMPDCRFSLDKTFHWMETHPSLFL